MVGQIDQLGYELDRPHVETAGFLLNQAVSEGHKRSLKPLGTRPQVGQISVIIESFYQVLELAADGIDLLCQDPGRLNVGIDVFEHSELDRDLLSAATGTQGP